MNLIVWIVIGLIVNTLFLKDDLLKNKETFLAGIVIVIIRAVTGGVISNYLFEGGIGSLDFATFTMTGIAPLVLLLLVKIMNIQEAKKTDEKLVEKKIQSGKILLSN